MQCYCHMLFTIFTVILGYRKSKSTEITELVARFGLEVYLYRIKSGNVRRAVLLRTDHKFLNTLKKSVTFHVTTNTIGLWRFSVTSDRRTNLSCSTFMLGLISSNIIGPQFLPHTKHDLSQKGPRLV